MIKAVSFSTKLGARDGALVVIWNAYKMSETFIIDDLYTISYAICFAGFLIIEK